RETCFAASRRPRAQRLFLRERPDAFGVGPAFLAGAYRASVVEAARVARRRARPAAGRARSAGESARSARGREIDAPVARLRAALGVRGERAVRVAALRHE